MLHDAAREYLRELQKLVKQNVLPASFKGPDLQKSLLRLSNI